MRKEERKGLEKEDTDMRRRRKEGSSATERESNNERKLSEVKVSVSSTRKRSEESQSNCDEKRRCSKDNKKEFRNCIGCKYNNCEKNEEECKRIECTIV